MRFRSALAFLAALLALAAACSSPTEPAAAVPSGRAELDGITSDSTFDDGGTTTQTDTTARGGGGWNGGGT